MNSRQEELSNLHESVQMPADSSAPRPAADLFDLSGRVAIVTGATRGLGLAIARTFCGAGGQEVAAELRAGGAQAVGLACHVGHWDELDAFVAKVYDDLGRVDVLVNNAGISPVYESVGRVSEELWDKVIAVNLKGPFRLSALIGERMVAGEGGSIINVSSTGAARPTHDIVPYAAAKAGLNALTVGLADSFGPKVRVNAIMPGPFLTSIARDWDPDLLAQRTRTFPLRRAGEASEIVGAALYLASDASSSTTGSVITVDGGAQWSMPGGGDAD
jgi:NAD(P)-dependent dehydrogenase (short-subunit alcohol dehydrogenase family)